MFIWIRSQRQEIEHQIGFNNSEIDTGNNEIIMPFHQIKPMQNQAQCIIPYIAIIAGNLSVWWPV